MSPCQPDAANLQMQMQCICTLIQAIRACEASPSPHASKLEPVEQSACPLPHSMRLLASPTTAAGASSLLPSPQPLARTTCTRYGSLEGHCPTSRNQPLLMARLLVAVEMWAGRKHWRLALCMPVLTHDGCLLQGPYPACCCSKRAARQSKHQSTQRGNTVCAAQRISSSQPSRKLPTQSL